MTPIYSVILARFKERNQKEDHTARLERVVRRSKKEVGDESRCTPPMVRWKIAKITGLRRTERYSDGGRRTRQVDVRGLLCVLVGVVQGRLIESMMYLCWNPAK